METISELRDRIVELYGRFDRFITPVLKFFFMMFVLIIINSKLGYMEKLSNIVIVIAVSLIVAFLPLNASVVIAALFILLHLYKLSLQVVIIVGLVFAIMFVLYFRFSPKDALAVIITPILFMMKLPYVVALLVGFLCGPLSFVSVACGTIVHYMVDYISNNSDKFSASFSADNALSGFKTIIDNVLNNDTMIVMVITLSVICVLANVIKRFSFDYSWYVALAISSIAGLIVVIIGSSAMDADVSIGGSILSMFISVIITFAISLFVRNVDYSSAEYVCFEDDEFVYYVKAIPRITTPEAPRRRRRPVDDDEDQY